MGCARQMAFSGPLLAGPSRHAACPRLVLLVLLALAVRALVPVGFMPAEDGTLSLTICTDGFPPALSEKMMMEDGKGKPGPQPQHPADPDSNNGGYCAFTTGFSSAPPPLMVAAFALLVVCLGVVLTRVPAPAGVRLVHTPQARAPPAHA